MSSSRQAIGFLKDEFIYGGHVVGLGAASIAVTSALMLDIAITWDFVLIVYLLVYLIYSYDRLAELKKDSLTNRDRTEHIKREAKILPINIVLSIAIITMLSLRSGDSSGLLFCYLLILGSISYSKYLKQITKKITGFKSFYVTLLWASLAVLLATYYDYGVNHSLALMFLFIYGRVLVNAIFCDIKDMDLDRIQGLKTIPVVLGKEKTLLALHSLNFLSFCPLIYGIGEGSLPLFSLALVAFFPYSFLYLRAGKKENVDIQKITYIIVDGEYILWSIVVILSKFTNC